MSEKSEIVEKVEPEEDTMNCGNLVEIGSTPNDQELMIKIKMKQRQLAQDLLVKK